MATRAPYEEWMKQLSESGANREVMEKDRILQYVRVYPPLDDTLYSAVLQRSGAPRSDLCEFLSWGKKALDGRKEGVTTTVDGRAVLYDPKEWSVKSDLLGCAIQWSWSVDTPGRVSIKGKAINLCMVPTMMPTLQVSVMNADGDLANQVEFELLRFKGMKLYETCVLAYSVPWDLRDGQTVELNVVEPSVSKSRTGLVFVVAREDACALFVDGAFVANAPVAVQLPEGVHVIEVKKAGYKNYRKEIKVTAGSDLRLRAEMEKE